MYLTKVNLTYVECGLGTTDNFPPLKAGWHIIRLILYSTPPKLLVKGVMCARSNASTAKTHLVIYCFKNIGTSEDLGTL